MPEVLNGALSTLFLALLALAAWWACRDLAKQTTRAADADLVTYETPRRQINGYRERPLTWDHFHDDYQ